MAEAKDIGFAYSLNEVLGKHPYENPMGGAPVYSSNVRMADGEIEKGFREVSQLNRDRDPLAPISVSVQFTHALRGSNRVLDAARRAIETNHPMLAGFTETDKRFLLLLAANIRLQHLEHHFLDQEARSALYPHMPDFLKGTLTGQQLAEIKSLRIDLMQRVTVPSREVVRV